jgi:hypothetical protein
MATVDRPKYLLVQYGTVIAAGLVLAGVIALGGAWAAAQPTETTERVPVYQEEVSTSVGTSAAVTGNTTLYNESEVLRDKPVYLFRASPNLTLTANTSLDANRTANVTHRLELRFRASRGDSVFWRNTTTYVNETRRTSDGRVSTAVTIDVPAVRERAARFREEIGSAGTFGVDLRLAVTYEVRESPTYRGELTASAPLVIDAESYRIDGDLSTSETEEAFATRRTTTPPDPVGYLGFGAVGVLALVAAAGSVLIGRSVDAEEIRTRLYRNRYDEWISRGELPTGTNKRYVRIDNLEDIVDIGIDSNKRVIWDADYDIYAVVDGDVVYYYAMESAEVGEWLNL